MTFPTDITTTIVTGTYVEANGDGADGWVVITPSATIKDSADNLIIAPVPIKVDLDANGHFALVLPTNQTGLNPNAFVYQIQEFFNGGLSRTWNFQLLNTMVPTIDLSGLSPAVAPNPSVTYPTLSDVTTIASGLDANLQTQINTTNTNLAAVQTEVNNALFIADVGTKVPPLVTGKIPATYIPHISLGNAFTVTSQAAMTLLPAGTGDLALRTDINQTFMLTGNDPSIVANWTMLPTGGIAASDISAFGPNWVCSNNAPTAIKNAVTAAGGAVCSGTNDDLQVASKLASYKAVYLTEGTFNFGAGITIPAQKSVIGSGTASTLITAALGMTGAFFSVTGDRVNIRNLGINSSLATTVNGIYANITSSAGFLFGSDAALVFSDIEMRNVNDGVTMSGTYNTAGKVARVNVWTPTGRGFVLDSPDGIISECTVSTSGGNGFETTATSANWKAVACRSYSAQADGYLLNGTGHIFSSCEGNNSKQSAFRLLGTNIVLTNPIADSNSWVVGNANINVYAGIEVGRTSGGGASGGADCTITGGQSWDRNPSTRGRAQRSGVRVATGIRGLSLVGISTGNPTGTIYNVTAGVEWDTAADATDTSNNVYVVSHRTRVTSPSVAGFTVCTSGTRPATPFQGQMIFETDTSKLWFYTGTAWAQIPDASAAYTTNSTETIVAGATGTAAPLAVQSTATAVGNRAVGLRGSGDSQDRYTTDFDGKQQWGPGGSTAPDTNWYRTSAGTLKTDGSIVVQNGLTVNGSLAAFTGAFTSYTPTWTASTTNPVIGNGTIVGWYLQIGKVCFCYGMLTAGSTTTYGSGNYSVSLPLASNANATNIPIGSAWARSASDYQGFLLRSGASAFSIRGFLGPNSSSLWNPAAPFTFASGNWMSWFAVYEVA